MARSFLKTALFVALTAATAVAQSHVDELRTSLQRRFEILPIANGIVLRPRFQTGVRSIELSDSTIALDGLPATGAEVQKRLGNDADLVLRVSYLDAAARRSLALDATPIQKPAVADPAPDPDPDLDADDDPSEEPRPSRARARQDVVRIGGSVKVAADETVRGDVVVVGGSANIDGEVRGNVVVVGGSATFGPQADIHEDVTVVGGGLVRDAKAMLRGEVHEVGFGDVWWRGDWDGSRDWTWGGGLYPITRLTGTLVRITLLILLAALVLFVARAPVEQIADRVAADPVKSWFVGFLVEMLFVPVLIMAAVVLAISIVGIPLLVLLPVAVVALLVVMLVGFTAVAYHLGRVLQGKVDALQSRPYAATFAGIVLIVAPVILARLVGLTGDLGFIVWPIAVVGFLLEYLAWTAGLGAAALARFGRPAPTAIVAPPGMIAGT